jgi:methylenetetrahydrofolate dehydrogenase (NADP+) / methenyltetrahydrofolate cyclohydrolase
MKILDGKIASEAIINDLKLKVENLVAKGKKIPHLAAVLVGNDGASETYVASKVKTCKHIGYKSTLIRLESNVSEEALINTINQLNNDEDVDGILVQLPLPQNISTEKIINTINPYKDVDGFHPINIGKMVSGIPTYLPATPYGILLLMRYYGIDTKGKHAVIVGRSNIVGRPMSILLSRNDNPGNCTVTVCHRHSSDVVERCKEADIIIAAVGIPYFVKKNMVKQGAVIIDVGITRVKNETKKNGFALVGDVAFDEVAEKSSFITPVPGGVGPMTIAGLMKNTYWACTKKK